MSEYEKTLYWFDSAEYDLATAKAMLETKRYLYVGFMCHQTIEKALKGVFVSKYPEDELPYIHRLVRLSNQVGLTEEMSDAQLALLDQLNPMNVEARYPLHKERLLKSLTQDRCEHLISETEDLLKWLKTKS